MAEQPENKTSTGMQENLEGLLCYLLTWVTGIIFLIVEKENRFVRFHAFQSIMLFGGITVINVVLVLIPIIGWIIAWLLGVIAFIFWIICMIKAYQGQWYKVPVVGKIAEKQVKANTQK